MPDTTLSAASPPTAAAEPAVWRIVGCSRREPDWRRLAVRLQAQASVTLQLEWVSNPQSFLARLSSQRCDAAIVGDGCAASTLLELLQALRTQGVETPMVVLAPLPVDELLAPLYEFDCEVCVTPRLWDSPVLPPLLIRAIRRGELARDHQRLLQTHQRRLVREREDVAALLQLQQDLLQRAQQDQDVGVPQPRQGSFAELAHGWAERYAGVLHAFVLSGTQRLSRELERVAAQLAAAGFGPRDVLQLHAAALEQLVAGLGGRSSRQVVARAGLIGLELVSRIGELQRSATDSAERPLQREP